MVRSADEFDLIALGGGEGGRFGENVQAVKSDAGDVFDAREGIDVGLCERTVDDSQFHDGCIR